MADANKMRITRNTEGTEVLVTDAEGQVHDISSKFREISGTTTPGGFQNSFKAQDDGTSIDIEFTAVSKELNYTLDAVTAKQLCALAED